MCAVFIWDCCGFHTTLIGDICVKIVCTQVDCDSQSSRCFYVMKPHGDPLKQTTRNRLISHGTYLVVVCLEQRPAAGSKCRLTTMYGVNDSLYVSWTCGGCPKLSYANNVVFCLALAVCLYARFAMSVLTFRSC